MIALTLIKNLEERHIRQTGGCFQRHWTVKAPVGGLRWGFRLINYLVLNRGILILLVQAFSREIMGRRDGVPYL